jgi:hypothetical protein
LHLLRGKPRRGVGQGQQLGVAGRIAGRHAVVDSLGHDLAGVVGHQRAEGVTAGGARLGGEFDRAAQELQIACAEQVRIAHVAGSPST